MVFIPLITAAYLFGSIPFGLLIAKAHGVDLRSVGSGNIGATNVARALGRKWAVVCFVLDFLKGFLPMIAVPLLGFVSDRPGPQELTLWLHVGIAAVIGHIYPVYLRFKGGKGVATSLGIVVGLWPYFTLCGLGVFALWAVCVAIWRYISLASIIAACCFPLIFLACMLSVDNWTLGRLWPLLIAAIVMSLMIALRHRQNIRRLLQGTEPRVFQKKK